MAFNRPLFFAFAVSLFSVGVLEGAAQESSCNAGCQSCLGVAGFDFGCAVASSSTAGTWATQYPAKAGDSLSTDSKTWITGLESLSVWRHRKIADKEFSITTPGTYSWVVRFPMYTDFSSNSWDSQYGITAASTCTTGVPTSGCSKSAAMVFQSGMVRVKDGILTGDTLHAFPWSTFQPISSAADAKDVLMQVVVPQSGAATIQWYTKPASGTAWAAVSESPYTFAASVTSETFYPYFATVASLQAELVDCESPCGAS